MQNRDALLVTGSAIADAEPIPDKKTNSSITPSLVQRDFNRIIQGIGTPAVSSKPRGFSTGRVQGNSLGKRKRQSVLKKGQRVSLLHRRLLKTA